MKTISTSIGNSITTINHDFTTFQVAFKAALANALDGIMEAARLLVSNIRLHPEWKAALIDSGFDRTSIERLEAIGEGRLFHKLLFNNRPGVRALARVQSVCDQQRFFEEPLPVLQEDGEHLLVSVHDLNEKQARQVFSGKRIRSLAEQRLFLQSQKALPKSVNRSSPYVIRKNRVEFREPCVLTVSQLAQILMEASGT